MTEPTPLRVRHGNKNAQNIYLVNPDGSEVFVAVAMNPDIAEWLVPAINLGLGGTRDDA